MSSVHTDQHDQLIAIRLDDGKLNVLTAEIVKELRTVVEAARSNGDIRALALLGRDGAFVGAAECGRDVRPGR